jgi:hypothetical protein
MPTHASTLAVPGGMWVTNHAGTRKAGVNMPRRRSTILHDPSVPISRAGVPIRCQWNATNIRDRRCHALAVHTRYDRHQQPWTHLCPRHTHILDAELSSNDRSRYIRAWICASGGSVRLQSTMRKERQGEVWNDTTNNPTSDPTED